MSQEKLGELLSVCKATIGFWERGKHPLDFRYLSRIYGFLGYCLFKPDPNNLAFPEKIILLRKKLGLTQAELARHLGKTEKSTANWESGDHYPMKMNIKIIDDLLKSFSKK